jgi:hypothetical protein
MGSGRRRLPSYGRFPRCDRCSRFSIGAVGPYKCVRFPRCSRFPIG